MSLLWLSPAGPLIETPVARFLASAPKLPPVQSPTLGIWSSGDQYLPEDRMVQSAAYVTGSWRYERIEAASHWVPLDQPDRLNAVRLRFLPTERVTNRWCTMMDVRRKTAVDASGRLREAVQPGLRT